jgi:hypothetical protein
MTVRRAQVVGRAMYRAATNKVTLCLTAATAVVGMVFQSGGLCAIAVGGYLLAMTVDLGRNQRWRQAVRELRREAPAMPSVCQYHDGGARQLLLRIERARDERERVCRSLAGPAARTQTDGLLESAAALEEMAFVQLDAFDRVTVYLGTDPLAPLRADLARLEKMQQHAPTPAVRAEYEAAVQAVAGKLRALERTEGWRELLRARLEKFAGVLEALPVALVELELRQASAVAGRDGESPLEAMADELNSLQEANAHLMPALTAHPARYFSERGAAIGG